MYIFLTESNNLINYFSSCSYFDENGFVDKVFSFDGRTKETGITSHTPTLLCGGSIETFASTPQLKRDICLNIANILVLCIASQILPFSFISMGPLLLI